jgi:hypothetical protein
MSFGAACPVQQRSGQARSTGSGSSSRTESVPGGIRRAVPESSRPLSNHESSSRSAPDGPVWTPPFSASNPAPAGWSPWGNGRASPNRSRVPARPPRLRQAGHLTHPTKFFESGCPRGQSRPCPDQPRPDATMSSPGGDGSKMPPARRCAITRPPRSATWGGLPPRRIVESQRRVGQLTFTCRINSRPSPDQPYPDAKNRLRRRRIEDASLAPLRDHRATRIGDLGCCSPKRIFESQRHVVRLTSGFRYPSRLPADQQRSYARRGIQFGNGQTGPGRRDRTCLPNATARRPAPARTFRAAPESRGADGLVIDALERLKFRPKDAWAALPV